MLLPSLCCCCGHGLCAGDTGRPGIVSLVPGGTITYENRNLFGNVGGAAACLAGMGVLPQPVWHGGRGSCKHKHLPGWYAWPGWYGCVAATCLARCAGMPFGPQVPLSTSKNFQQQLVLSCPIIPTPLPCPTTCTTACARDRLRSVPRAYAALVDRSLLLQPSLMPLCVHPCLQAASVAASINTKNFLQPADDLSFRVQYSQVGAGVQLWAVSCDAAQGDGAQQVAACAQWPVLPRAVQYSQVGSELRRALQVPNCSKKGWRHNCVRTGQSPEPAGACTIRSRSCVSAACFAQTLQPSPVLAVADPKQAPPKAPYSPGHQPTLATNRHCLYLFLPLQPFLYGLDDPKRTRLNAALFNGRKICGVFTPGAFCFTPICPFYAHLPVLRPSVCFTLRKQALFGGVSVLVAVCPLPQVWRACVLARRPAPELLCRQPSAVPAI